MDDDDDKSSQRTTDESNKVRVSVRLSPSLFSVGFTPPDTSNAFEAPSGH